MRGPTAVETSLCVQAPLDQPHLAASNGSRVHAHSIDYPNGTFIDKIDGNYPRFLG
jgi:hypothetical protein